MKTQLPSYRPSSDTPRPTPLVGNDSAIRAALHFAMLLMAALGLSSPLQAVPPSHRWYLPSAAGTGTSSNSPVTFSTSDLATFLSTSNLTEFTVHFLPSTTNYSVTSKITIPARPDLSSLIITLIGEGTRPEDVRLVNTIAPVGQSYDNPDYVIAMNLEVASSPPVNAERLVIENLLIDGNWDWKLAQLTYPERVQGYKNSPLNLRAKTGAVRKVIVRNFGAAGYAPWNHIGGSAGVETFPVVVGGYDVGQTPPTGWRRPWVVEDCEIHGFNSLRAGYTTMLMVHAITSNSGMGPNDYSPSWVRDDLNRRFVHVRNVQFRSDGDGAHVIAMGNAAGSDGAPESGRSRFTDNIVLNASLAYNGDTGRIKGVDFVDSMGLNVWWWFSTHATPSAWHHGFDVSRSSVRLGPMANYPSFRSFCWKDSPKTAYTDTSLILGRQETNSVFALVRAGGFTDLRMENNWITTIQGVHFDETAGGNSSAQFRLLEKILDASGDSCERYPVTYEDGVNLMVGTNYVSSYAHDFDGLSGVTTAHTNSTVTAGASNSVQNARIVLQDPYLSFRAAGFGRLTRVLPVVSTNNRTYVWKTGASTSVTNTFADPVLYKAIELSMDEPTIGSTNVALPVRLVRQTTPSWGYATEWGDGSLIWLTASGLVSGTQWLTADGVGEGAFNLAVTNGSHGEINVTLFHDPRTTNGASGSFSEYEVAHSKGIIRVGTVVSVEARTSIAVDRRESGAQAGSFWLTRSGSTNSALTVQVGLGDCGTPATLTTDYALSAVSPAGWTNSGGTLTLTFAAGQRTAELIVTPVEDEVIEAESVCIEIEAGSGYAASASAGSASIFIHDGPEWTLYEITHSSGAGETKGVGLSDDTDGGVPTPMIAANHKVTRAGMADPSGGYETSTDYVGGGWFEDLSAPEYLWGTVYMPEYAPLVTGVSDGGLSAVFSGYKWVGTETHALKASGTNWSYLSVPSTGWLTNRSRALCFSPNGTYIGGYATRTQSSPAVNEQQPVIWDSLTFGTLFDGTGMHASRSGEVLAVNNSGEFVGQRTSAASTNAAYLPNAFRTRADGASVLSTDMLIPPDQSATTNKALVSSVALAITARSGSNSGDAVGWALWNPVAIPYPRPVIWWRRADGANETNNANWLFITQNEGVVNAISPSLELYGQVSDAGGTNSQAWRWKNSSNYGHPFSDKAYTYGYSTNWVLKSIVDVTPDDLLIGNGTKGGSTKAFLIVRKPSAE